MRLIEPSFEIWEQPAGLEGIYKQIEKVGRVCYKSEDKITEDSAKPFVDRMIKSGHGAMLEHGTVYLHIKGIDRTDITKYLYNKYSKVVEGSLDHFYVTSNYRVLVENDWLDDLKYLCEPTEYHEKRICVKFICDRAIANEFVRHRTFSFLQESTRYCNYSKDKFCNELTFIEPCWFKHNLSGQYASREHILAQTPLDNYEESELFFLYSLLSSEQYYLNLIDMKWKPEQARAVLPNALKTELVMTGFVDDWQHFFRLRSRIAETGKPHPQALELANPLMDEFVKRGIMENISKFI